MTAARIARRLVRKIIKPAALWLNDLQLRQSEEQFEHLQLMRGALPQHEQHEKLRQVQLIGRRNAIRSW